MSRSYRKPYGTYVRYRSLRWDRQQANRGVRRAVKQALHKAAAEDYEDFLAPHQYECHHNDPWGWASDGTPHYLLSQPDRDWSLYCRYQLDGNRWYRHHNVWPPTWWAESTRK